LDVFAAGLAGACVVLIPESQVGLGKSFGARIS
jgi:hypothetical protein